MKFVVKLIAAFVAGLVFAIADRYGVLPWVLGFALTNLAYNIVKLEKRL